MPPGPRLGGFRRVGELIRHLIGIFLGRRRQAHRAKSQGREEAERSQRRKRRIDEGRPGTKPFSSFHEFRGRGSHKTDGEPKSRGNLWRDGCQVHLVFPFQAGEISSCVRKGCLKSFWNSQAESPFNRGASKKRLTGSTPPKNLKICSEYRLLFAAPSPRFLSWPAICSHPNRRSHKAPRRPGNVFCSTGIGDSSRAIPRLSRGSRRMSRVSMIQPGGNSTFRMTG